MAEHAQYIEAFTTAATNVGARVVALNDLNQAIEYLAQHAGASILLPGFPSAQRAKLEECLKNAGVNVLTEDFRACAGDAESGVSGVNFAIADTGTLVLESTNEDIRLATTLPTRHFALLDPVKILADGLAAVDPLRQMHQREPRNYVAYITGPSRTADIERVLTIGVHGPKELHILLVPGLSSDPLEM